MSSFVLIHGASHGAWCWEKVVPFLEADARVETALALDLPGRGALAHMKPLDEFCLADYADHVVREIESRDLREIVLVGHSLAGLTLPRVAHRVPERLRQLVYLASANPKQGRSVMDLMQDPRSPVSRGISQEQMFCNDLDAETSRWLLSRLCDEPPGVLQEPVENPRGPERIPSVYILLERDETLPPDLQREQAANAGVDRVISFDAGHSAFAAKPQELALLLLDWA